MSGGSAAPMKFAVTRLWRLQLWHHLDTLPPPIWFAFEHLEQVAHPFNQLERLVILIISPLDCEIGIIKSTFFFFSIASLIDLI